MAIIVAASKNKHKIEEIEAITKKYGMNVVARDAAGVPDELEIEEDGETFEENALIKARTVALATGCAAIADDSGLEVDALHGAPGVYSARFAGVHGDDNANNAKLLQELDGIPDCKRTARFVSVICVYREDGASVSVRGTAEGLILTEKKGRGTFGYDPLFYYPPFGKTFAEMDGSEKNSISHRGNALALLMEKRDFFLK